MARKIFRRRARGEQVRQGPISEAQPSAAMGREAGAQETGAGVIDGEVAVPVEKKTAEEEMVEEEEEEVEEEEDEVDDEEEEIYILKKLYEYVLSNNNI